MRTPSWITELVIHMSWVLWKELWVISLGSRSHECDNKRTENWFCYLKGLCHDSAHVWDLTVADCFWTNRKRVRRTQGNLHNSRFIVREAGVVFVRLYIPIIHIYSVVFPRYMLQTIRIRLTTLSCFETNIYPRVFSRTHASKHVSRIGNQK